MGKKKIIILGAGLAGLSAALHLQNRGIDCQIFEKESEAGGLCRSQRLNGFSFDHSGHLLHFKDRYVFNLVRDLLKDNLIQHKRNAWIYSHNRFIPYPFQGNLYGLPANVIRECLLGFINAKNGNQHKEKNSNFQNWIKNTFGNGIARHFMLPYNQKFWAVPLGDLTCEWLDGFIPQVSLNDVIRGIADKNPTQFGYNVQFWYPKKYGISQLPKALAGRIKNIHTSCRITGIDINKKEIKISGSNKEKYDYLISTLPLPELPPLTEDISKTAKSLFKKLRWNSIFNLNIGIDQKDCHGRHWIYFPQKDIHFFRVGFYHNFSPQVLYGKSSIYVEVSYSKDRPIDRGNIVRRIKEDLKKVGIIEKKNCIKAEVVNDIKYGYPVYDTNYNQARNKILKYLYENDIFTCGRYGSWRYMTMENAILDGKNTIERICRL